MIIGLEKTVEILGISYLEIGQLVFDNVLHPVEGSDIFNFKEKEVVGLPLKYPEYKLYLETLSEGF